MKPRCKAPKKGAGGLIANVAAAAAVVHGGFGGGVAIITGAALLGKQSVLVDKAETVGLAARGGKGIRHGNGDIARCRIGNLVGSAVVAAEMCIRDRA